MPATQRRRDLLDAGLRVFLDRGVAAATIDQITERAGIAKGSFYLHFDSKERLLAALQADFEGRLVARVDAAVAAVSTDGGGWDAQLDSWVQAALADYPDDHALHDVLFHHPVLADRSGPGEPEETRDLVESLTDLIEHGVAAGAYDTDDPALTAMLLCSALHRAFDRVWHRDQVLDLDRLGAGMRTLFRRALALPADAGHAAGSAGG
jgi:AcrR family transcriptional regulator